MLSGVATAKINLALVVGSRRPDGNHEVVTVAEKVTLGDVVTVAHSDETRVDGFPEDTIARAAIDALCRAAGVTTALRVVIEKAIPVSSGLGGGSSDAAAVLRLGNRVLGSPLSHDRLHEVAATLGADVPLFLHAGPVIATGDGTTVAPVELPRGYHVVLWFPAGAAKVSTAAVYRDFDARGGEAGFEERRRSLLAALAAARVPTDLACFPLNDLQSSHQAANLIELGAFRADVSGAGPTVYGLFERADDADHAARVLAEGGRTWRAAPATDV
jgi:4-diphosphocytidyl-2-C-methyl-D-erythritol kinase